MEPWNDPAWPAKMMVLAAMRPPVPSEGPTIGRNTIWVSVSTKRRARVLWHNRGCVGLSYDDQEVVQKTHVEADFLRLYKPA